MSDMILGHSHLDVSCPTPFSQARKHRKTCKWNRSSAETINSPLHLHLGTCPHDYKFCPSCGLEIEIVEFAQQNNPWK